MVQLGCLRSFLKRFLLGKASTKPGNFSSNDCSDHMPNPSPFGPKSAAKNSWLYGARPTEIAKPRGGILFSIMTPSVATLATALVLTISSPFHASQAAEPLHARIAPPPVVRSQPSAAVASSLKPEMYPSPALFGGVASVTAAAGLVFIRDAKAKAIKAAEEAAAKEVSEEAKTFFDRNTFFAEEAATKEAREDRKAFFVRSSFFAAEEAAAKVKEAAVQRPRRQRPSSIVRPSSTNMLKPRRWPTRPRSSSRRRRRRPRPRPRPTTSCSLTCCWSLAMACPFRP